MKKVLVGVLYFVLAILALITVATVGTMLYHGLWVPLLGVGFADAINMVLMISGGGLVGHYAAMRVDDFMDRFGV